MSTLQSRLAECFPSPLPRGVKAQIASLCKVAQASVTNWFGNPEKVSTISRNHAEIICAHFNLDVSPAWLADGTLPKKLASNVTPGPELRGKVPLISWVQAGEWCSAADPHLPGQADRWMDCPVNHSGSTFALRVRGDSMTAPHPGSRTYPEGCIIFVDPEKRTPVNGDRVVACLEDTDEVTFKIYKNEDGRQWLQALNPLHKPIRRRFHILGTVLGKWEDG